MTVPVVTALNQRDRLWPMVLASVAVHVAVFSLALKVSSRPDLDLEQTPIQTKLVRLGEKKPEQLLPQKEPQPTPPEPAPAAPAPVVAEAPRPAPPTPVAPTPAPTPARPAAPRPATRSPANGAGTSIAEVLARTEKQVQRERWGDPNGDVEGDSDEASGDDPYGAKVRALIKRNYQVPITISDRDRLFLVALLRVWIEPDGTISRSRIEKSSGNPQFDDALERAVKTTRVPPPPPEERDGYRSRGRIIQFKITDA